MAPRKEITSPSSDSDEPQVSFAGSAGEEDGSDAALSGSDSDSDSLDSDTPRKKRKVSVDVEIDPVDDEPYQAGIISSIAAPSRIGRKAPVKEKAPAAPVDLDLVTDTTPANVPLELDTTFESLGLRPWLVQSLSNMAIRRPTKIQKETIPEILQGKDCIGGSRTGSGKTVAFATPILQRLAEDPSCIFAVVLTATRYEITSSTRPCRN